MSDESKKKLTGAGRMAGLQWLRAFAALIVVIFHCTEQLSIRFTDFDRNWIFELGARGVDLFFVISGFIIFWIHGDDGLSKIRAYLIKRSLRIYPVYWVVLVPVVTVGFIFPGMVGGADREWGRILASFFLLPQQELPVLGVAWTLTHELYFYLLFLIYMSSRKIGTCLIALVSGGSLAVALGYFGTHWLLNFFLSPYNLLFFSGAATAFFVKRRHPGSVRAWQPILYMSIVGIGLYVLSGEGKPWWPAIASGAVANGMIVCSIMCNLRNSTGLEKILSHLGDASYSLYLVHYPVLVLVTQLMSRVANGPPGMLAAGVMGITRSIVSASLLHFVFERPLLRFAKSLA